MNAKLQRLRVFAHRHKNEFSYFWKYAIPAKFRLRKYRSRGVILLRLDLIGDCTMFTSSAAELRRFYQDRSMTVVCLSISRPVFERLGIFDKIICVDFKPHEVDYEKLAVLIEELRKEEYDLLLQPQASKYPLADILAAAIKCNRRIAIATNPGNSGVYWVRMVNFLYNRFIPVPKGNVSEFDYYGAFVRGVEGSDYQTTRPSLPYGEQHFIEGAYYVLYPGGSLSQKFWPAERFAELANHIYQRTGLRGVILGVSREQWVSDRLKAALDFRTAMWMIDLTGKTSIFDVIDIIGNAALVVSNDTSGVHIAAATNTPSVASAGGWFYGRFLPYHIEDVKPEDHLPLVAHTEMPCYYCNWDWVTVEARNQECLRRLNRGEVCECLEQISVEQMRSLVDQIIEEEAL